MTDFDLEKITGATVEENRAGIKELVTLGLVVNQGRQHKIAGNVVFNPTSNVVEQYGGVLEVERVLQKRLTPWEDIILDYLLTENSNGEYGNELVEIIKFAEACNVPSEEIHKTISILQNEGIIQSIDRKYSVHPDWKIDFEHNRATHRDWAVEIVKATMGGHFQDGKATK